MAKSDGVMKKGVTISIMVFTIMVAYFFRLDISFKDLEPIVSILQNTSAMVFTIMGIWIAYMYPNVIASITQPSKVTSFSNGDDFETVRLIVGIVILSAMVAATLMFGLMVRVFIINSFLYSEFTAAFNFLGLLVILTLVYAQLFCIYIVIVSCVNFIKKMRNTDIKQKLNKKFDRE